MRHYLDGAASRIREDSAVAAVCGLTLLAALVRFATLDVQSFWLDEAITVLWTLEPDLPTTLADLRYNDATPPLYPVLAWLWSQPFGTGEVGLRSLSAVFGTATVPLLYVAGASLLSKRAGVMAAALGAVNPVLVWYSQEARPYALLVFLATLTVVLLARALEDSTRLRLALWAGASALLIWTHYLAAFVVGAEAVVLLLRCWRAGNVRRPALAVLATGAAAAAVLPLAVLQSRPGGGAAGAPISDTPLDTRISAMIDEYAGRDWPASVSGYGLRIVPVVLMLLALGFLLGSERGRERESARLLLAVLLVSLGVPLVLGLVAPSLDYFLLRYMIGVVPVLLLVLAAGLSTRATGRIGAGVAVSLCLIWLANDLTVASSKGLQRADWRGASAAIGASSPARAIVLDPWWSPWPLRYYRPGLARAPVARSFAVDEVVLVSWRPSWLPRLPGDVGSPAPGFRRAERRTIQAMVVVRFRAPGARRVTRNAIASALGFNPAGVYLEGAPPKHPNVSDSEVEPAEH